MCGCGKIDIYALEEDDIVYDAEPQKTNTKNFPKRSRLYQGLIDSNLLPPGSIDFNKYSERIGEKYMNFMHEKIKTLRGNYNF